MQRGGSGCCEGYSEEENQRVYHETADLIFEQIQKRFPDLSELKILEIGSGNGYYTERLAKLGARSVVSMDITDVLFSAIRQRTSSHWKPDAKFEMRKADISRDRLDGQYDLILFIDVIEHIVVRELFDFAMANVHNALKPGGLMVLAPVAEASRDHLFYNRDWSLDDIRPHFESWKFGPLLEVDGIRLMTLERPMK